MDKFYDSATVRAADVIAVAELGFPDIVLMENAGRGAAELLTRLYPSAERYVILCGPGNNGGDGFVVARHLTLAGFAPSVVMTVDPQSYKNAAATAVRCARNCGVSMTSSLILSDEELCGMLSSADLAVDALLGTGSRGAPRGEAARVITLLNNASPATAALDVPSGIDPDTGLAEGVFVRADVTATFLAAKKAFATRHGKLAAGKVFVCHIGVPPQSILP